MSISVVIPVFDGASVVPWSVPAVLALTGVDEIVWVDDGSCDGTATCVSHLASGDPRVRVLSLPENRGRAAARNAGAAATHGDTLLFLDADVRPPPDLAARFAEALRSPGAVATVARLTFDGLGSDPYHAYLSVYPRGASATEAGCSVPWKTFVTTACAVSRSAFDAAGGFDEQVTYGEDLALACILSSHAPFGLVTSAAQVVITDAGTLDTALDKVAEFGCALASLARRTPNVYDVAGLNRLQDPPLWMRALASDLPARLVRRAVTHVPLWLRVRGVRYLLGQSLLHAHADAARSLARAERP